MIVGEVDLLRLLTRTQIKVAASSECPRRVAGRGNEGRIHEYQG